jgi:hypothetical protein
VILTPPPTIRHSVLYARQPYRSTFRSSTVIKDKRNIVIPIIKSIAASGRNRPLL